MTDETDDVLESEEPSLTATLRFPVPDELSDDVSDGKPDDASEPTVALEAPRLRDVAATFAGWARAVPRRLGSVVSAHRRLAVASALACIGLVLAGVLFALRQSETPSDRLIMSDARERLSAPTATACDYVSDDPLVLDAVEIARKGASPSRKDACDVALQVRFANAGIEATAGALLTYVRDANDAWSCEAASVDDVSFRALAGVSTDAVAAHVDTLLRAAGSSEDEGEQLVELYRDADVELVGERFNEEQQTDSLTLHCSRGTAFMSRECDLTAHFRFVPASGAWELAEARVSDGAFDLGFQPLVGTWVGTFQTQQAKGGKCLAAREVGLALTIAKASVNKDGVALVEGTLSGVAHLHDPVEGNVEADEGDELLEDVPFAGTLRTADGTGSVQADLFGLLLGEDEAPSGDGIVFDCVTQDLAHGTVRLTLDFGAGDNPDAATATLTSEHPYLETFALFWTYEATVRYEDTFTLSKAE